MFHRDWFATTGLAETGWTSLFTQRASQDQIVPLELQMMMDFVAEMTREEEPWSKYSLIPLSFILSDYLTLIIIVMLYFTYARLSLFYVLFLWYFVCAGKYKVILI